MAGITIAEASKRPDLYQVCKNGVVRDRKSGRFVAAGENSAAITPTSSQRMIQAKHALWEESFNAGIARTHGGRQELAIQAIGSHLVGIATTHDGLPAVKAAAEVARLGGWVERQAGKAGTTVNVLNVLDGAGIADLLRDVRDIDVIDVE